MAPDAAVPSAADIAAAPAADAVTAPADVAPADAAPVDVAPADAAPADAAPAEVAPPVGDSNGAAVDAVAATPLAPEIIARILTGEPGCVALGRDGRSVLWIDQGIRESGSGRETWLYFRHSVTAAEATPADSVEWNIDSPAEALADPDREITKTFSKRPLVGCKTATGRSIALRTPVPITIESSAKAIAATFEGRPASAIPAKDDSWGKLAVAEVYWAPDVRAVFVRLEPSDQPNYLNELLARVDPDDSNVDLLW